MGQTINTLNVRLLEKLMKLDFNIPKHHAENKFWIQPIKEMVLSIHGSNTLIVAKIVISIMGLENMRDEFPTLSLASFLRRLQWRIPRMIIDLLRAGAKIRKNNTQV